MSYEDNRRGMSRGLNHSTREATRDAGREQKVEVGRQKASAITTSTGLRRRERRFESCRGHHLRPAVITLRTRPTCPIRWLVDSNVAQIESTIRSTSIVSRIPRRPRCRQLGAFLQLEGTPGWAAWAMFEVDSTAGAERCSAYALRRSRTTTNRSRSRTVSITRVDQLAPQGGDPRRE